MCLRCHPQSRKYWVFGCGTFFVLLALIVGLLWPAIANLILHKQLELKKGSVNYKNWIETPIPMYIKFTMFNWTNPDDIRTPNYKPNFVEMGPYVFSEKHKRVNVTFHPENDTVSFDQIRTWHYIQNMSNGSLDDEVTNVNVIAASAAFSLRHSNAIIKMGANAIMDVMKVKLTVTKTVRELLFDGYSDPFLTFVKKLPVGNAPPFSKFGWFVDRNGSWSYDGHFEMRSGQADIKQMGSLTEWNYVNKTKYYHGDCSKLKGTSGELWPMDMNPTGDISLFVTDLCRPLTLSYQQQHTRFGVTGSRWVGDSRVFDNGRNYLPNNCYCTGATESCPDLLSGVHNMSDCRFGAPVFASFPHFYLADKKYVNSVTGLSPNQSKHEFSLSLEPYTGIPLDVDAKIQINALIQPISHFKLYENIPKLMIPTFWFSQTVELDEKIAKSAKIALQLPSIGLYLAAGVSGLGIILLLVGAILTITKSWSAYQNLEDEPNSDSTTS
ncbi:protein croquemort-like isoform X2 [Contarinia nasturtii]|nr:protein croquemort-like isoform X2 [Contarinia nasturtii]XP_031627455.1 protein croquemort-like isoform X2 [Contarinia nasturtii]